MNKKKLIFTLFYFLLGGVLTANASITIYVNSSSSSYYMYAWNDDGDLTAAWPGTQFSSMSTTTVDGVKYYYMTFDVDKLSVIFDTGSTSSGSNNQQTSDITDITEDTYFNYSGGTTYTTVSSSNTTESFTVYVNSSSEYYYLYAWSSGDYFTGTWPGAQFSSMGTTTVSGTTYYYYTFTGVSSVNLIFNTGNDGSQTGTVTVTEDTYFTYSGGTTYSTSSSAGTTYYLVADAGAKCKFTPDRTRNGGSLNYSYQNLHLQDFIIRADGNNFLTTDGCLQFHIEDADGTKYYLTGSNTSLEDLSSTYSNNTDGSNFNGPISGDTYFDALYNGDAAALYWVPLSSSASSTTDFKIKAGIGKSYTFLWQPSNSGLYLIVNGEEFGDATSYYTDDTRTSAANYYLIGNFADASAATNIDPYSSDNRRMLTPYYYKDGDEYGGSMTDCDSIVYKIEVARPSAGWSELYLDLVNEEDFNTYSSSSWSGNENAWAKVIRPEATWISGSAAYALDATALTGGLMRNENASYQSLNPVVSDDIDSYVFTMNASTSTYSIRFVSAASNTTTDDDGTGDGDDDDEEETEETASYLYIFGTAVGSSEGSSTTSDNWSGANAFKLTYNSTGGYYYYAGSDGATETAIPMTAAGVFAFVTDMDFSKGYYTEDGNLPPTLIEGTTEDGTTTYTSTETTAYSANTGGGFYETQYVNMLGTNRTAGSAAYSEDNIRTITWGLPSGDYYIRFYVGATIGEYAKNLYTVRRSYTLLRPDAEAVTVGENDYTTFKVFCDYNAVVVPSDVVVLYVPEITSALTENTDNSSDYTTYDLELKVLDFGDNARVLPAKTPVILAMTTKRSSDSDDSDDTGDLESSTITMDYYSDPTSTLNSTVTAMTPSIPYEAAPEKTADDGESYNFFFGYRKLSDTDKKPTIGFYLPISGGYSAINGAYLNLSSEYLGSSDDENSAKEAVLVFYSDLTETDETDGSETTGISNALAADDADADGAYYTLQGMRIATPTVKGIYIHNGKKTVVR